MAAFRDAGDSLWRQVVYFPITWLLALVYFDPQVRDTDPDEVAREFTEAGVKWNFFALGLPGPDCLQKFDSVQIRSGSRSTCSFLSAAGNFVYSMTTNGTSLLGYFSST